MMTRESLLANFEADFIPPKFYPTMEEIGSMIGGNHVAIKIREHMLQGNMNQTLKHLRGENVEPPEIGLVYGALTTGCGTIISPWLGVPSWPDEPRDNGWQKFVDQYLKPENVRLILKGRITTGLPKSI